MASVSAVKGEIWLRPYQGDDPRWWAQLRVRTGDNAGNDYLFFLTFDQVVNLTLDFRGITLSKEELSRAWELMDQWVKKQEAELP